MEKSILVFGGAGYIGSHMCHLLLKKEFTPIKINPHDEFSYDSIKSAKKDYDPHTISVYVKKEISDNLTKDILKSKPKRVIFNPGAENYELEYVLKKEGIEVLNTCTLVLYHTKNL